MASTSQTDVFEGFREFLSFLNGAKLSYRSGESGARPGGTVARLSQYSRL
ncbi:MAG: hypothetical protein J6R30_01535 [Bacteroidales bacterium]|nr:hypothetical protein [Bacteroidales bacterium]